MIYHLPDSDAFSNHSQAIGETFIRQGDLIFPECFSLTLHEKSPPIVPAITVTLYLGLDALHRKKVYSALSSGDSGACANISWALVRISGQMASRRGSTLRRDHLVRKAGVRVSSFKN